MTRRVTVAFTKWPAVPHWRYEMLVIDDDEHGTWLWAPPGTALWRGDEPQPPSSSGFLTLVPRDRWWMAIWNPPATGFPVYVDVATPPRWEGDTVTAVDLDLDVVRTGDGEVRVLDEDEFLEHAVAYPPHLVAAARTTTAELVLALEEHREPFGEVGVGWLERVEGGLAH